MPSEHRMLPEANLLTRELGQRTGWNVVPSLASRRSLTLNSKLHQVSLRADVTLATWASEIAMTFVALEMGPRALRLLDSPVMVDDPIAGVTPLRPVERRSIGISRWGA